MNLKKTIALLLSPLFLISCSSGEKNQSEEISDIEKPVLKIEEVEISYSELDHENGTVIPVDYSVSGIVNGWSSSGIHIAFDDRLGLKLNDMSQEPSFKAGDAVENISSILVVSWKGENPPEELNGKNMNNISVITAGSGNNAFNGVIATIDFIIPPDAKAGDIYNIEFFKYKTDCFTNVEQDKAMQDFAFENWQNGYIKITD